jgi:hypothetical protein
MREVRALRQQTQGPALGQHRRSAQIQAAICKVL